MPKNPLHEQECQQDALERLNNWLNVLEARICILLEANDLAAMKPSEREQAANRHLALLLRLLQLRQRCAQAAPSPGEQALLEALFGGIDEE
jgi:hypothetical protein